MPLASDILDDVEKHHAQLLKVLVTPKHWGQASSFVGVRNTPYGWMNKSAWHYPANIKTYDEVVESIYPQHIDKWHSSSLRKGIADISSNQNTQSHHTDLLMACNAVEIVEGWVRNPLIWDDIQVEHTRFKLTQIGFNDVLNFQGKHVWAMRSKALANNMSLMPDIAISALNSESRFGIIRGASGLSVDMFADAAQQANYDLSIVEIFTSSKIHATTVYRFIQELDLELGNPFLWLAAFGINEEYVSQNDDTKRWHELVKICYNNNLSAVDYIKYANRGIPLDQMLQFSSNNIDGSLIEKLLGNSS